MRIAITSTSAASTPRRSPGRRWRPAFATRGRSTVEPGVYPVVLSPYAVADLIAHLADLGFSALARQERRSFMRPGERLMSRLVTVADDAADPEAMPYPFDDEGVSSRGVTCVEEGVCRSFVHDSATALRENVPSTGHALPMPNTFGPWARHLVMAAGDRDMEELTADCDRGLYVTRLLYVRDVHPLRTIITGMTRDGTFLIEGGQDRPAGARPPLHPEHRGDAGRRATGWDGSDGSSWTRASVPSGPGRRRGPFPLHVLRPTAVHPLERWRCGGRHRGPPGPEPPRSGVVGLFGVGLSRLALLCSAAR